MFKNPFSSDYSSAPATLANNKSPAIIHSSTSTAAASPLATTVQSADLAGSGFIITTPITNGKPRRVIVKGKVTSD